MYFYYIIVFNHSERKSSTTPAKYRLNRYSVLLNGHSIPLIHSSCKVEIKRLANFYLQNFIGIESPGKIIKDVMMYYKYKNIRYIFVNISNIITRKIEVKYKWKHYIDMIDKTTDKVMDDTITHNINSNIIVDTLPQLTLNDIVSWWFNRHSSNYN